MSEEISLVVDQLNSLSNMSTSTSVLKERDTNALPLELPSPIKCTSTPGDQAQEDGQCQWSSTPKIGEAEALRISRKTFYTGEVQAASNEVALDSSASSSKENASPNKIISEIRVTDESSTPKRSTDSTPYSPGEFIPYNITVENTDGDPDKLDPICYSIAAPWTPEKLDESLYVTPESSPIRDMFLSETVSSIPRQTEDSPQINNSQQSVEDYSSSSNQTPGTTRYLAFDLMTPGATSTSATQDSLTADESAYQDRKRRRSMLYESATQHAAEGDDYPAKFSRTVEFCPMGDRSTLLRVC